jgi:hypothetical protein
MKRQDIIIDTTSGSLSSCSNFAITLNFQGRKEAILILETCVQLRDWVLVVHIRLRCRCLGY